MILGSHFHELYAAHLPFPFAEWAQPLLRGWSHLHPPGCCSCPRMDVADKGLWWYCQTNHWWPTKLWIIAHCSLYTSLGLLGDILMVDQDVEVDLMCIFGCILGKYIWEHHLFTRVLSQLDLINLKMQQHVLELGQHIRKAFEGNLLQGLVIWFNHEVASV